MIGVQVVIVNMRMHLAVISDRHKQEQIQYQNDDLQALANFQDTWKQQTIKKSNDGLSTRFILIPNNLIF